MVTITRKGLYLSVDDTTIPSQGSSDVEVLFNNDTESYQDYLIEPRVGYYINGCPKSVVCKYTIDKKMIIIPKEAFNQNGVLVIAIALINNNDSNHIEVTKPISFEVSKAPNEAIVLPNDDTWQTAVDNLVEQLFNKDYAPQFNEALDEIKEAVKTANTASQNANEALDTSNQTNELINNKLESGELKGEAGKSILYGEGVPTDEIGNVGDMYVKTSGDDPYPFYAFFKTNEGWMPSIKMQGVDGTDTLPIEAHVFYPEDMPLPEGYEVDECTLPADIIECNNGLNVEQMFNRPKQLLINNDFQINQRGKNQYNFNSETFGLDCWQHRQGNYSNAIIVTQIDGGGCHVRLGTDSGAGLRQYVASSESCLGKPYTAVISIDGVVYKGTVKMRTINDPDYIGAISNDRFGVSVFYDEANKYIAYSLWVPEGNKEFDINYVDLFEGNIVYPHVKEDCAIALQECQNRVIVYNELTLPCDFSYIDKDYDSIIANLYLPTNFKGQPNISYDTKEMGNYHDLIKYTDFSIWSKKLYGANIIRIVWKKDSGTFHDTIKDAYVYMKNLVISCEETL